MRFRYLIIASAILALVSCAKEKTAGLNEEAKRYFDAWISQNYPDATKTPLGAYILSDTPGTGTLPGDSAFVRINYTTYSLAGAIQGTTYETVSRRVGTYDRTYYYGPVVVWRGEELENLSAGIEETISTMKVGGRRTVVIPGWLSESERYDTPEEYVKKCSGTNYIYELELVEVFNDVDRWERDSLIRYMNKHYPAAVEDTTYQGFFYVMDTPGENKQFGSDTTIYVNYTGRLLNGQAFDTTIKDTAKVWGLYSASSTYEQARINWFNESEDFSYITMGEDENSLIVGFSYGLSIMHPGESGKCFFISKYGYSGTGSGSAIPAYSPLCFELQPAEEL